MIYGKDNTIIFENFPYLFIIMIIYMNQQTLGNIHYLNYHQY